jgi:Penicillinase repressor
VNTCEPPRPSQQPVKVCLHSVHNFTPSFVLRRPPSVQQLLRKKVKVEITDEEGTTYSLALHGQFSHEKVMRMMELIDFLGQTDHNTIATLPPNESTTYGRILKLVQSSYATKEFSSADIARDYEDRHASQVPLSTVSTYLSRLADRGILSRQKFGNSWVYHINHLSSNQLAT